jgi:NAD(P)-dependent dehydrogenase (short-subunit alcohol dehydrogenase family)
MDMKSVVLVTGASSGMGKETARRLLEDGYIVYVCARRLDQMDDLVKLGAIALQMDVTKEDQVAAALGTIERQHGGVDVLINNAGFGSYGALEDTSIEDARYQFEVNLFGPARLIKAVLPRMRRQGHGKIVNLSSMGGRMYTPLGSWYHASKHALEGWSDCLRLELAPFGIDVIIIEPGVIETGFGGAMLGPMMERSGHSAYADMARKMEAATTKSYETKNSSPASLVAQTISDALKAKQPKTRYPVGKMARPLMFLRKWLGDRIFDRIVLGSI